MSGHALAHSTFSLERTYDVPPEGAGARLTLTEQATFLDGHEPPAWREQGTGDWLDKLTAELHP